MFSHQKLHLIKEKTNQKKKKKTVTTKNKTNKTQPCIPTYWSYKNVEKKF